MHENVTNAVIDGRTDDEWETQGTHTDENQDENCDGGGGDMHENVTNAVIDGRTDDEWETQGTHTDPDVKHDASSSSGEGAVKGKCAPKCQDSGPEFDSDSTYYDDDNQDPDYSSDDDTDDTNVDELVIGV